MTELNRRDALLSATALGALALAGSASAADMAEAAAWDLTDLYPSNAAWDAAREAMLKRLPDMAAYRGLGESAATLKAAEQLRSDLARQCRRLGVYAGLKADADLRVAANQERRQLSTDLFTRLDEATSWMKPELIGIGQARIEGFLASDPGLAPFRFRLEDDLRQGEHTLTPEGEAILAASGNALSGPGDIRGQLASSDIPRPTVTLSDGARARLDDQGYQLHRATPSRADRKLVFDQYFASYKQFESSLGAALASQTQGEMFQAKARHYPSSLDAALFDDNIPQAVYRTLIAETNAGLPVLHRYYDLRRRMLGLPDIGYYDIYPSLVKLDRTFTLDEMRALTIEAVKPLGADYDALFASVTARKWMDPRPRQGKYSGAYMDGAAYDVHPYLLLNLNDKYEGLTTYAHEWGHAMHTLLADKAQPFELSNYPTFTAEIASTCHELLLARYMLDRATTREEKLFYLGNMMETYRLTYFRQAMFAEFQLAIHDQAEKGEALSGARMTAIYGDLLRKYQGPKMILDPVYSVEWASIPHFYMGFYVFQYATSITASTFYADKVLHGTVADRDNYLAVLRAGGSDYGYNILKTHGLDMATPTPYQTLIRTFGEILDQAEKLLG